IYLELRKFIVDLYKIAESLPKSEDFGLKSQLKRAATSILLNIAEGSLKKSDKELRRFLLISIGSLGEVVAILDICLDQKYIASSTYDQLVLECETFIRKLYSFYKSIKV